MENNLFDLIGNKELWTIVMIQSLKPLLNVYSLLKPHESKIFFMFYNITFIYSKLFLMLFYRNINFT